MIYRFPFKDARPELLGSSPGDWFANTLAPSDVGFGERSEIYGSTVCVGWGVSVSRAANPT